MRQEPGSHSEDFYITTRSTMESELERAVRTAQDHADPPSGILVIRKDARNFTVQVSPDVAYDQTIERHDWKR